MHLFSYDEGHSSIKRVFWKAEKVIINQSRANVAKRGSGPENRADHGDDCGNRNVTILVGKTDE